MRNETVFSTLHPGVLLTFSLLAPALALCSLHPLFLGTAFLAAVISHWFYYGGASTGRFLLGSVPLLLFVAAFNALFNHRGMHVMFRLFGYPVTVEALLYGLSSGVMLLAVLLWFRSFNALITAERFLYLFGARFPNTALLLCMILKLFPDTQYRMRCISHAQKGFEGEPRGLSGRLRTAARRISCLLEWSMEDGLDAADSMKARGYGTGKRTCGTVYPFRARDGVWLAVFLLAGAAAFLCFPVLGAFRYYPVLTGAQGPAVWSFAAGYLLVLLLPLLWEGAAALRMARAQRKFEQQGRVAPWKN